MDFITSVRRKVEWRYVIVFILSLSFQLSVRGQSVPIYANTISSQDNVDSAPSATDGNPTTRARIRASSGILVGIGAYTGHLELQYPATVPANTTSYVKINTDDNLLPSLLGGSLGGLLSDVLGTVLIGNQEFTVQAKMGNTPVLTGESQVTNAFASPRLRIVVNAANEYFIAITPAQDYDRIRLTNRLGSLVGLNNVKRLDVYEVFYIGTQDVCGGPSFTSFDGAGLNLDLLGLGGAGVANPHFAIDANPNNYSRLSLGVLAVAASIEQTVYFDGLFEPTDQYYVRMRIPPALLGLGVVNNIQILGYNGPNLVHSENLGALLDLDLLTLLQGNQVARIPFFPNGAINRVVIRYNSLLNVQLTQSLDLFGVTRGPARPVINDLFTLNPRICEGSTASLVAESGTGTELVWYAQPTGGTVLAVIASGQPFVTPVLTENTSFYVAARRIGCTEESERVRVNVTVVDLPVADDISIANVFSACNGNVTLSPSSSIGGAVFKYYKDQQKTQEITTGYAGDPGVTYVKNDTTGALSISGLTAVNSPYQYCISLTVDGLCENVANTLKAVTVNYSSALILTVTPTMTGCGSVDLSDAIVNFDSSSDIQYLFFDGNNNPITTEAASAITASGTYYIQMQSLSGSCSSSIQQVEVTVSPQPVLTIANANLVVNLGTSVTLEATADAPITWYDAQGNALPSNTYGPFTAAGFYTFTAIASNGNCSDSGSVSVVVIDPANCPPLTERVYANTQSWSSILTGGVANAAQAIDGNPQTFSTITTGIGLLGIGTTWQTLQWNTTISAGTPLTVKLGSEYSGLVVAGAYSVIGTKRNGAGIPVDIGTIQPVSGSLADLLAGDNNFEFTFVPSDNTGPKAYDGVRIIVGSLVSVAQNVKVYEAYYDRIVTQVACGAGDVEDVFSGAVDLGVGAATSTVGVANPFNSVDSDVSSFATMFSGAGVLAAADLTVSFRTPTLPGDRLEIILSRPSTVLNLNLLAGFTIQMYNGNTPVTPVIDNTSSLLTLNLLGGGNARVIVSPQTVVYDRIKIRFGGVATVLDQLRVHDIRRFADTSVNGADETNTINVCQGQTITLNVTPEPCTTYVWYDAETGGNVVSTGTSFTVPMTLAAGTYTYYIQPVRFGCETYSRGPVTIVVGETAPPTAITDITLNGGTATTFCDTTDITLSATLDSTATITNPIFYWYSFDGTTQTLIPNQSGSTLTLTGLAPGTYTYYVGVSSDEYCPTAEPDRDSVTFTILPSSQPTDINANNTLVCQGTDAVLTPTTTLANPEFSWYFTNDTSQPIVSGSVVGGATYTISASGVLSISGLTVTNSPYTYYVGLVSGTTCLNQNGNFKEVTVIVNDSGTPTTNDTTQDFCVANNPTITDIQVNEPSVIFYDAPTAGNLLPADTALVDDAIYYAAFDASTGCGSSTRLAITVNINDAGTPTTNNATQEFCLIDSPTVANIQVNEPDVVWYLSPNGGTPLLTTDALVNGSTYFASLTDAVTGCESSVRLAVVVNINNPDAPTTNSSTQDFCLIANATIANIQVNETGVIWYDAETGGNSLASTTTLVDGATYYAALFEQTTGCESSERLAVTININDTNPPTTNNANQNFCLVNNPTIGDIQVNETGVIWYNAESGGTALASTDALANGVTYYASIVDPNTGCESATRLAVTIGITDPATPTTNSNTQSFCVADLPTVSDLQVNETGVIWYNAQTGGTQLTGDIALIDGAVYYAAAFDSVTGCESSVRLVVTVDINDAGTPTTNDDTQDFCQSQNPTVADIQVNEANVVFFDAATGGNQLTPDTALTNGGVYYVSFDAASGCASSIRLAVTVAIINVPTPTTIDDSQDFCITDNPTVADIQVNEANVTWYNASTGGNVVASSTALATGIYYASLTDPISGCESGVRLAITVSFGGNIPATLSGGEAIECVFEEVTYTTEAGMTDYVWTVSPNGTIVQGGQLTDNYARVAWMAMGQGNVDVSYYNSCSGITNADRDINIETCSDLTITKTVDNPTPNIDDIVTFTITVNNVGSGEFHDLNVNETLPNGYAFVSAAASVGTYSNVSGTWTIPLLEADQTAILTVSVTVLPTGNYLNIATIVTTNPDDIDPGNNSAEAFTSPICLIVYNEFSPNEDGSNDTFRIDCIENFPNNKFEVYNRYGALVYSQSGYANDWDGTANVSGAVNKDDKLPTGTYYYTLDLGMGGKPKSGWLSITR
ncbi:gliding motility-associated C-terminal domain-containing protein [Flavobacterium sp.]|uniref:Ig-like domain-containing protein n=1 Tax=Flavobacterium sp. TaxID=239 RepID=UPI0039E26852